MQSERLRMDRRKVCLVVGEFPLLSHTFVISQIEGLMRRGYDVSIVCDRIGNEAEIDTGAEPMRTMLANTRRRWPVSPALSRAVSHLPGRLRDRVSTASDMLWNRELNNCDLVLAHFGGNGLRLARMKKRGRLAPPLVTIFHGNDIGIPAHEGTLDRYLPLFRYGACQLTVNEMFRRMLIDAGAPEQRVMVHRMGIDCDGIPYRPRAFDGRPLELISVCRLVEKKGIAFALRALALLRTSMPELDWRYSVIGNGPLLSALRSLAGELGIADRVRFHGALPHAQVKAHLARGHVFLLPSVKAADGDVEGVPVALMEAMASGLLVVSTFHSGIPELVENHRSGLLAEEGDVEGIAAQIEWIAGHPHGCAGIAMAARERIETQFSNEMLNDRLSETITSLLRRERAA
jgi:colanic acid/amylovoran biosynthesis glycosyltransferase